MESSADHASSMTKALRAFEGPICVDHKIQNAMKHASKGQFITQLEMYCRGTVAHFRRSSKEIYILLFASKIYEFKWIHISLALLALRELNNNITRPN